ncbi:hypothetical protein EJ04DRAFT_398278, partial [Polyplosphaeria fusca]
DSPPVYIINLSLPPELRYVQVAKDHFDLITSLTVQFDELVERAGLPKALMHFLARTFLRRLHSNEQTRELRGIQNVTGVPMYLLVAYNVLLDLLMGCTSGGVTVREPCSGGGRGKLGRKKMMHFRMLDWDMDPLRQAVVQFDFTARKGGPVIARVINYVGYVGVLTGVRVGLSASLNFRPYKNNLETEFKRVWMRSFWHILLVLTGFRPSISSRLRDLFIPRTRHQGLFGRISRAAMPSQNLTDVAQDFSSMKSSSCYLVFCDGSETLLLEKDHNTAKAMRSDSFIAVTNHDVSYDDAATVEAKQIAVASTSLLGTGMEEILAESAGRKEVLTRKWTRHAHKSRSRASGLWLKVEDVQEWISEYPVTNEQTHFATIMDPTEGNIVWTRRY